MVLGIELMIELLLISMLLPKCWVNSPPVFLKDEDRNKYYLANWCKYGKKPQYFTDKEKLLIEHNIRLIPYEYKPEDDLITYISM